MITPSPVRGKRPKRLQVSLKKSSLAINSSQRSKKLNAKRLTKIRDFVNATGGSKRRAGIHLIDIYTFNRTDQP
jgi:hypothetical protein